MNFSLCLGSALFFHQKAFVFLRCSWLKQSKTHAQYENILTSQSSIKSIQSMWGFLRAHVLQQSSVQHGDFAISHVFLHLHLAAVTPKPSFVLRGVEFLHLWTFQGSPRFLHLHPNRGDTDQTEHSLLFHILYYTTIVIFKMDTDQMVLKKHLHFMVSPDQILTDSLLYTSTWSENVKSDLEQLIHHHIKSR